MDKQEGALHEFGRRLSLLREEQNISVADLALRCGLSARDIAAIEAGEKDIHITDIFRLAAGLGIAPSQLLASL